VSEQGLLLDVDPFARRELDFYETFRWQVGALDRRLYLKPGMRIVEPCAGNHAITRVLQEKNLSVWSNDIVTRREPLDSQLDACIPATWQFIADKWGREGQLDVAITNLPFGLAFAIAPIALAFVRVAFITLLRSTWDEPVEDKATKSDKDEWLARHDHLLEQITMPRADYRGDGKSESATHNWFIFAKDRSVLWGFGQPGWRTVTRRERDDLVRVYGDGH
jgi:hypothetical protein